MEDAINVVHECDFLYDTPHVDNICFPIDELLKEINLAKSKGAKRFHIAHIEGIVENTVLGSSKVSARMSFQFEKYDKTKLEYKKKTLQNKIGEIDKLLKE